MILRLWALVAAFIASPPSIIVAPEVAVAGREIYLGNLLSAESRGQKVTEELDKIFIAPAPLPGRTRLFKSAEIYAHLAVAGITTDRFAVVIPDQIRVTRRFQTLSPSQIKAKIRQDWLPLLPWKSVELERIDIPENVLLPLGELRMSYGYAPRADLCQPFYLKVEFVVDGAVVQQSFYRTALAVSELVPVAARFLSPDDRVSESDIRWEERRLSSTLRAPVKTLEFLEEKRARSTIAAGEILLESYFRIVPLIRRGDDVVLLFENDRLRVTMSGKSLSSGSKGDRIRVMNVSSKKELFAVVLDEKTVKVNF
jgi:flagella basal body P-ring formation protein FlgA